MIVDYVPALENRRRPRRPLRSLLIGGTVAILGIATLGPVAYGHSHASAAVTVHHGDTLWSIAAATYPGDDISGRIAEIMQTNHLQSAAVHTGETLLLPGD